MTARDESGRSPCSANFCTDSRFSQAETNLWAGHPQAMLTEIYIEALLVDEELADQVWVLGRLSNKEAINAWMRIAAGCSKNRD